MSAQLGNYKELIKTFINSGYKTKFFTDKIDRDHNLLLRHDVDFEILYAEKLSRVEDELNIKSTYFFLLRSPFYNITEKKNIEAINSIKDRGHQISIHFDNSLYSDLDEGMSFELELFKTLFNDKPKIISIHRPNKSFINNEINFKEVTHTYNDKFFKEIKYISDSQGAFRYGHPIDSEEFKLGKSIHLCLHPVWWIPEKLGEPNDIINDYLSKKTSMLEQDMVKNFIPFTKNNTK